MPRLDLDPEAIADRTIVGVFFRQAAKYGDKPIVHYPGAVGWKVETWADMKRHTLAVASSLVEAGVQPGDHVIVMSENRIEWLYCDLGIQSAGAITVPIYPSTPAEVAGRIAVNCDAVIAIVSGEKIASKFKTGGSLRQIVRMDADVLGWLAAEPQHLDDVIARLSNVKPDDVCTIVYTSGTTGDPKGAVLAQHGLVDLGRAVLKVFPLTENDSTLSFLPYAHVFERINGFFTGLLFGGQTWISRGIEHLPEDLTEVQPTILLSVPRVYEKMHAAVMEKVREASASRQALFRWAIRMGSSYSHAEHPGPLLSLQHRLAERLVLGPLRRRLVGGKLRFFISGGSSLAKEIEEFFWAIGVPILNGYGMTELSSGCCSNTLSHHRFLTVGKPFPGVELKIADDGEILVKSPGALLEYYKNPEATAEMLGDGWIRTGDIGEIDKDGFLRITDRKKDLIKTAGGKYVAPQPLEFQLLHDPLVEQAVVIGESRPYVTALVVPDWAAVAKQIPGKPEELVTDERVHALLEPGVDALNKTLGSWETIKYFTLLPRAFSEESGEMTPTLKVKRKVVNERYKAEIEAMYQGKKKASE